MKKRDLIYKYTERLGKTLLSFLRVILFARPTTLPRLEIDSNELVILGNGPSLRLFLDTKISFLEGKEVMMVNFSALSDDYVKIRPKFYLLMDPLFFEDAATIERLFPPLVSKTDWDLTLFVPLMAKKNKKWQEFLQGVTNIHVYFFNSGVAEGFTSFSHRIYRWRLGMPSPRNVLVAASMIGLQLPFSTIYLAGADHSWLKEIWVDDTNTVREDREHFYDKEGVEQVISPHFLHELLNSMAITYHSYHLVEKYAKQIGKKIYNITPNSFIDAFERKTV